MENLENVLESVLFVNGESVDIVDITNKLEVTKAEVKSAVKKLQNKYKDNSGIVILEFNNKLQLASNSKYQEQVSLVLNPIRQRNLSKATLETMSIIAYKQPVTRLEIEEIRGVSSDYAINILLEHNLIEIVGRKDTVGKPVLFGTTDEFLKRFNIGSIDELPDYNELLEKVKVIRNNDDRLYNHFEVKSEEGDNGSDSQESEDLDSLNQEELSRKEVGLNRENGSNKTEEATGSGESNDVDELNVDDFEDDDDWDIV